MVDEAKPLEENQMSAPHEEEQENLVAKRKMRNYLIDSKFQLAWVLRVVLHGTASGYRWFLLLITESRTETGHGAIGPSEPRAASPPGQLDTR